VFTLHLNSDAGYAVLLLTLLGAPVTSVLIFGEILFEYLAKSSPKGLQKFSKATG